MMSIQVFYEGNVQGVGFRWSMRHIAKGFELTGWVRNLPDGRVEPVRKAGHLCLLERPADVTDALAAHLA